MWPFDSLRRSHWVLLGLVVLFLFTYFGLLSWGRVEDALESLAAYSSGAKVFQATVDRADAIFIVFMFLMLTPMAVVAVGAIIAFIGTVLAGFLESLVPQTLRPDLRRLLHGIEYVYRVSGTGEHESDAVAHEPGTNDGDVALTLNHYPAVKPPST